jgi:hypothetical protein
MINEIGNTPEGQFMLGRLQGRQNQRARGEQTSGRIKQTTRRADEYWRGTDFNAGENFEDPQSWADSYDDYDQYGDFDSEAYERNQQERERDQERQSELYSRVQNKLSNKTKNENKNMSKKNTIRLTESELKRVISKSVKNILKEGFNSPLPSFAAKEVEPKHRLRKQWDDDYDAMVARNHARGEEFMDDFNKKANLSYGKSLKENQENLPWNNSDIQNDLIEIKRIASYLVNDYLDNVSQEQLDELGDMTQKYRQFLSIFMKQIDSERW